jgi:hypothetical protein
MRNAYEILVRKPEGKRPLRRPRHRWEHNVTIDFREIGLKLCTGCIWLTTGANVGVL